MSLDALGAAAVAAMNAASWSTDVVAEYEYIPSFHLEDIGNQLRTVIVPAQNRTSGRLEKAKPLHVPRPWDAVPVKPSGSARSVALRMLGS